MVDNIIDMEKEKLKKEYIAKAVNKEISNTISIEMLYAQIFSLLGATSAMLGPDFIEAYKAYLENSLKLSTIRDDLEKQYQVAAKMIDLDALVESYKKIAMQPIKELEKAFEEAKKNGK